MEANSVEAIKLVKERCAENHPSAELVKEIKDWLTKDWEVRLLWCFREENRAAHGLAKASTGSISGTQISDDPPDEILNEIRTDLGVRCYSRWTPLG